MNAARLALSLLTVAPVGAARADRGTAGRAMLLAPGVGLLLGGLAAAVAAAVDRPPLVAGGLAVAALALATRGLHLDGLADTVDGLGAYGDAGRALDVMRGPGVGAFAVAAVALDLLLCAAALGAVGPLAAVAGVATGRVALLLACRRGVPAARPEGLGALVAGSVPVVAVAAWSVAVAALALPAVGGRPWQGPLAVVAALAAAGVLVRHAVRRLGGVTGDVLGAACEVATVVALSGLAIRG